MKVEFQFVDGKTMSMDVSGKTFSEFCLEVLGDDKPRYCAFHNGTTDSVGTILVDTHKIVMLKRIA